MAKKEKWSHLECAWSFQSVKSWMHAWQWSLLQHKQKHMKHMEGGAQITNVTAKKRNKGQHINP